MNEKEKNEIARKMSITFDLMSQWVLKTSDSFITCMGDQIARDKKDFALGKPTRQDLEYIIADCTHEVSCLVASIIAAKDYFDDPRYIKSLEEKEDTNA